MITPFGVTRELEEIRYHAVVQRSLVADVIE